MLISFLLDMCYVFYFLVIEDSCTMMPAALKKHGSAFACGVTRSMTIIVVLLMSVGIISDEFNLFFLMMERLYGPRLCRQIDVFAWFYFSS